MLQLRNKGGLLRMPRGLNRHEMRLWKFPIFLAYNKASGSWYTEPLLPATGQISNIMGWKLVNPTSGEFRVLLIPQNAEIMQRFSTNQGMYFSAKQNHCQTKTVAMRTGGQNFVLPTSPNHKSPPRCLNPRQAFTDTFWVLDFGPSKELNRHKILNNGPPSWVWHMHYVMSIRIFRWERFTFTSNWKSIIVPVAGEPNSATTFASLSAMLAPVAFRIIKITRQR